MSSRHVVVFTVVALVAGVAAGYWVPRHVPGVAAWLPAAAAPGTAGTASGASPAPARSGPAGGPPPQRAPVPVEVVAVESQVLERRLSAVGSLLSDESVMLRPEIAGRLQEINFQEGQEVKRGDLLFRLDDDVARAEWQQARANLALAESKFKRSEQLQKQGFISQQARDEADNALRVERANVALAQARLNKTEIRAPFDGQLGLRNVSVGDVVSAGQDLVTLQAIQRLKVDFRLPETFLPQVRVGQTLQIGIDALPDQRWSGEVTAISPLVDVSGRAVLLRARLENPDGVLRPGMFARVNLLVASSPALVVPETALTPRDNRQYVLRVADGVVQEVPVQTGQRQRGMVEVNGELAAGDQVIIAGTQKVENGTRVRPTLISATPGARS